MLESSLLTDPRTKHANPNHREQRRACIGDGGHDGSRWIAADEERGCRGRSNRQRVVEPGRGERRDDLAQTVRVVEVTALVVGEDVDEATSFEAEEDQDPIRVVTCLLDDREESSRRVAEPTRDELGASRELVGHCSDTKPVKDARGGARDDVGDDRRRERVPVDRAPAVAHPGRVDGDDDIAGGGEMAGHAVAAEFVRHPQVEVAT